MADELQSGTPPTAPEGAGAPPPEAPEAREAPAAPSVDERFAKLEADLARERDYRGHLESTLRLLQPQQPVQQGAPQIVRLPRDSAQRVAATLGGGWNEEQVQAHAPIFAAFLQELAGPLLVGIEGMADTVDLLQARQEVDQYETFAEEVARVREEYRRGGQIITRKQAVALVKARRMDDPTFVDKMIDERAKQLGAEHANRAAAAGAAVTEGGASAQKAGPEPTKGPRAPVTREQFAQMSLEEKRKALEGAAL